MTKLQRNRRKNTRGGALYAALAIISVIVLAVGAYFVFRDTTTSHSTSATDHQKRPASDAQPVEKAQTVVPPPVHQPSTSSKKHPEGTPAHTVPRQAVNAQRTSLHQLAIIIDDMGSSLQEARSLAGIGVPLTFAIIPGLRNSREVAAFAVSGGIETMIHIPMQSKGWPERRLESNGLLMSMTDAEISARMEEYIRSIPKSVGANNHMGSEFTEHEDKMRVVLAALKEKGLFFVDSVTSNDSAGIRLAKETGVKSARRNVFLDNEQNDAYIRGQLRQAVNLAIKSGRAIAICHPHPATIQTLASTLPEIQKQGISIVPVSQLVR